MNDFRVILNEEESFCSKAELAKRLEVSETDVEHLFTKMVDKGLWESDNQPIDWIYVTAPNGDELEVHNLNNIYYQA